VQTHIITEKQARQITGGRKPLVPVQYEAACKALAECIDLDDTKYWSDKADALAAWAKIYHDDKVAVEAKRLKLKAYRRMGEIAAELRPRGSVVAPGSPGPLSVLIEHGLDRKHAQAARRMATLPTQRFQAIVDLPCPPSPKHVFRDVLRKGTKEWLAFSAQGGSVTGFRGFCRRYEPGEFARGMAPDEAAKARLVVVEIQEWLDEFEQYLPK
jgi:hypothetical protein